jgi:hypothetical protein
MKKVKVQAPEQRNNSIFWAMTFCREGRIDADDPKFEILSSDDKARLNEARNAWLDAVRKYGHCTDACMHTDATRMFKDAGFKIAQYAGDEKGVPVFII